MQNFKTCVGKGTQRWCLRGAVGVTIAENSGGGGAKGLKGKEKAMSMRLECGILGCQLR